MNSRSQSEKTVSNAGAPLTIAMVFCILASPGLAGESGYEGWFLPSPDGKFVASGYLVVPPGAPHKTLPGAKYTVALRVRKADGTKILHLLVKEGDAAELPDSYLHLAWSPDSQYIGSFSDSVGDLNIVSVPEGKRKLVGQAVTSYRWTSASSIVLLKWEESWDPILPSGKYSVIQVSLPNGNARKLFTGEKPDPLSFHCFHSLTDLYHNQISPDGELFVYCDETGLKIVDLKKGAELNRVSRALEPSFCWWSDDARRCLIQCTVEDVSSPHVVYLYDTKTNEIVEITDKLRSLNKKYNNTLTPNAGGRIWSPDGNWFLVEGCGNWVCGVHPWSVACIRDVVGPEFSRVHTLPRVSPTGSFLALIKPESERAGWKGEVFVAEVSVNSDGQIRIEKPAKVTPTLATEWFWSADGKSIVAFERGKFIAHSIDSAE